MTRPAALVALVVARALSAPGLVAIRLGSILVAVTLVAGVTLYSTAMGDATLQASVQSDPTSLYQTVEDTGMALSRPTYTRLDRYVRTVEPGELGLGLHDLRIHHYTATVPVYRAGRHDRPATALTGLALNYYGGFAGQVKRVAGRFGVSHPGQAVPVVVAQATAQRYHLRLGDRLAYSQDGRTRLGPPLVVIGVFAPKNAAAPFWSIDGGAQSYNGLVTTNLPAFLALAASSRSFQPDYFWSYTADLHAIRFGEARAIQSRLQRVESQVSTITPRASLLSSLSLDIDAFLNQYALLPYVLLALVAPILALILYADGVVTSLILDRQAGEIALLRSRGASRPQIVALYLLDALLLGAVAVAVGPLLGLPLARLIGHASGFLQFGGSLPFTLSLEPQTYLLAAATALVSLAVGLVPAVRLARRSLLAVKGAEGRPQRLPRLRVLVDVLLLAAALYELSVLVRAGPATTGAGTAALAQDPLVAVAPLVFAVALSGLVSRVVPGLARGAGAALGRRRSPVGQVALQSVARSPHEPLRLVRVWTLTVTLGVFAATVAGVEATNRSDQAIYSAGTQLRLVAIGNGQPSIQPLLPSLKLPGVHATTTALRFETFGNSVNATSSGTNVDVLGIDPATAPRVMWFRPDFADQPLSRLLRPLAASGPSAIVSDTFVNATGLHLGDGFDVVLSTGATVHCVVAGVAHYFPTLDPRNNPFVVTNLSYLMRQSKSPGASEVWLATDRSQATVDRIVEAARNRMPVLVYQGLTARFSAQEEPLTAGIYGVVSVGFLIALALAILGFVSYASLSLQRRRAEFAIVRALGLSAGQLRGLILGEQVFLLGAGVLGGIGTGILTTRLFLPYLPLAANTLPPFLVVMPWGAIGAFVAAVLVLFVVILSLHVWMLLRLHLSRVLRLGET